MRTLALALSPVFLLAACAAPSSGGSDAGADAGAAVYCDNPPSSYTGNSKHVGAYCTPGGSQCGKYPSGTATLCAIDLDPQGGNFCILLGCKAHDKCGENACCTGRAGDPVYACVPITCLTDGGTCPDLPSVDGGTQDGGAAD